LDWIQLAQDGGAVAGSCEDGIKPLVSKKSQEIFFTRWGTWRV